MGWSLGLGLGPRGVTGLSLTIQGRLGLFSDMGMDLGMRIRCSVARLELLLLDRVRSCLGPHLDL